MNKKCWGVQSSSPCPTRTGNPEEQKIWCHQHINTLRPQYDHHVPVWSSSWSLWSVCWDCPGPSDEHEDMTWEHNHRRSPSHIYNWRKKTFCLKEEVNNQKNKNKTPQSQCFRIKAEETEDSLYAFLQGLIDLVQALWLRNLGWRVGFGGHGEYPAGSAGFPAETRCAEHRQVPATAGEDLHTSRPEIKITTWHSCPQRQSKTPINVPHSFTHNTGLSSQNCYVSLWCILGDHYIVHYIDSG